MWIAKGRTDYNSTTPVEANVRNDVITYEEG